MERWGSGVPGVLKPPKIKKKTNPKKIKKKHAYATESTEANINSEKNTLILLNPPNPRNPYQFERKNLYSTKIQSTNTKTKT